MRGRGGQATTFLLVVLVVAGCGGVLWWLYGDRVDDATADLYSVTSDVERRDAQSGARESVPASEHRDMFEGDAVTVDDSGRARLDLSGGVLEVYRQTELRLSDNPAYTPAVSATQLTHGTIFASVHTETIAETDWAVVRILGTECLVHVNEQIGLLWVIVADGTVEIEAAGVTITLTGGEQAWVWRGDPPVGPVPAARAEVPDQDVFPLIDGLTNGETPDGALLEPEEPDTGGGTPTGGGTETGGGTVVEPVTIKLGQSTGALVVPECAGDKELVVSAYLAGPDDAVAAVAGAEVAYGWNGTVVDASGMERLDDTTFRAVISPTFQGRDTTLVYTVTVRGANRQVLATQTGDATLTWCIG